MRPVKPRAFAPHIQQTLSFHYYRRCRIQLLHTSRNSSSFRRQLIEGENCPSYDPSHFFAAHVGQTLGGKYKLVSKLGWGTGSTVWLASVAARWPWQRQNYVALKITNSSPATQLAARRELAISHLMFAHSSNHPGQKYVRRVLDSFEVQGVSGNNHLCLAFEPLRQPMWMLGPQFHPDGLVPPRIIKALMPSILKCLDFVHSECHIIHTDLKGDHFMVPFESSRVLGDYVASREATPPAYAERNDGRRIYESHSDFGRLRKGVGYVKVTDFGLAVRGDVTQRHSHDIQPREYTAPEVMLRAGWSYPADMWNLGLVMWELLGDVNILSGRSMMKPEYSDETRMAQMIRLLGPPPEKLLARADAEAFSRFFDKKGLFKYPDLIPGPSFNFASLTSMLDGEEKRLFIAFAKRMLTWLPEERATAKDLLDDPWLHYQAGPKRTWISKYRFGEEVDNDAVFNS